MSVRMATRSPVTYTKPSPTARKIVSKRFLRDDFARDELRHQWHVLRQDAHLAFRAGERDHVRVLGVGFASGVTISSLIVVAICCLLNRYIVES